MTCKQDSNLFDSESEEEDSHFQFDDGFQFMQMKVKQTAIKFKPHIAKLFKQTHGTKIKLDLKKVILLDSQSTMDLICVEPWKLKKQVHNHAGISYACVVQ